MGKVFYALAVVLFLVGVADYGMFLAKNPESLPFALTGLTAWCLTASGLGIFGLLRERRANPASDSQTPGPDAGYGGFWKRVVALIVDSIILVVAGIVGGFIAGFVVGTMMGSQGADADAIKNAGAGAGGLLGLFFNWLYFTILESSARQTTFGKAAMGLIVTDANGRTISFARANGRYWGKILSSIPLGLGFVMVAFHGRKKGLHDLLAGTLVRKS